MAVKVLQGPLNPSEGDPKILVVPVEEFEKQYPGSTQELLARGSIEFYSKEPDGQAITRIRAEAVKSYGIAPD